MREKLVIQDDDGGDVELPFKYDVCGRCDGVGVHDPPEFSSGFSQDDFDEDPDFREEYMKGRYDVSCSECGGLRVVKVPDEDRMTEDQKKAWASHCQYQSELRAERRMREMGIEF